jgi:hypothetical protein
MNLIPVTVSQQNHFYCIVLKLLRAPTLICSPCSAILAWSEVGISNYRYNLVIRRIPVYPNFLLLVISSHGSRVGAREARQWACLRFISVVCGEDTQKRNHGHSLVFLQEQTVQPRLELGFRARNVVDRNPLQVNV